MEHITRDGIEHIKFDNGGESSLSKGVYLVLLALAFLAPIFFVPNGLIVFSFGKMLLFILLTSIALILWIFSGLQKGEFKIPSSWILGAFSLVALAYIGASIFSDAFRLSFFGRSFEVSTASVFILLAVLMLLVSSVFRNKEQLMRFHMAFFATVLIAALFQILRLLFGADFLSFDVLAFKTSNALGKWSDINIFFALGSILAMVALEFLNLSKALRIVLYACVVVGLFFVALVNSTMLWVLLGLFALIFFVYLLSFNEGGGVTQRKISGVSIALIVVSLVFVISGGSIGRFLNSAFGVQQIEARPSVTTTFNIGRSVLEENPFFGIGPNRFSRAWIENKPESINQSIFWNTDFVSGFGFVPTSIVETGIAGALAWILFFALFAYAGFRHMFVREEEGKSRYLLVGSFLASLFLWTVSVVGTPNIVLLVLAVFFTGTFIASLRERGAVHDIKIGFSGYPALNFSAILVSVVAVVLAVAGGYFASQRMVASAFFERGLSVFSETNNIDSAEGSVVSAINLEDRNDEYLRALAFFQIFRLNSLSQERSLSNEQLQERLQNFLSRGIQSAQNAVSVNPTNYQNWVALGNVYAAVVPIGVQGAYDEAKKAYERAIELNPRNPSIDLSLARLEIAARDNEAAKTFITNALEKKENYTEAIFLLSQIEIGEGNTAAAIRSVESAAVLSPNDPTVFFQLGLLKYNSADYSGAVTAFNRSITLNPQYSNARYFLGLSYEKLGRDEEAINEFEVIKEFNPNNTEIELILDNLKNGRDPFAGAEPPLDEEPGSRDSLPIEE